MTHRTVNGERRAPRGSAYIMVLFVASIVTLIGLSALVSARLNLRMTSQGNAARKAETLALTAVEHAVTIISTSPGWRSSFTHDQLTTEIPFDGGFIRFKVVDLSGDDDLASGNDDPVRVLGVGRVGEAKRVHSVLLSSGAEQTQVLACAVHAEAGIVVAKELIANGGPLSTDGEFHLNNGIATADIEANTITGTGTISGSQTAPAPPKTMPPAAIFDHYLNEATEIQFLTLPLCCGGNKSVLSGGVLGPASNPWGSTNPSGVYHVEVPAGETLLIDGIRLDGTLMITAGVGARIEEMGDVYAAPARSDYPVLLIRGTGLFHVNLDGTAGTLSIDPAYATLFEGLIHVMGMQSRTDVGKDFDLFGSIISEGTVTRQGGAGSGTVTVDPGLVSSPPRGYGPQGNAIAVVAGSWRWETGP